MGFYMLKSGVRSGKRLDKRTRVLDREQKELFRAEDIRILSAELQDLLSP